MASMSSSCSSLQSASTLLLHHVTTSVSENVACYFTDHPDSSASATQSPRYLESSGDEWYEFEARADDATPPRICAPQRPKGSHVDHLTSQSLSSPAPTPANSTRHTEPVASPVPTSPPAHGSGDLDLTAAAVIALQLTSPTVACHNHFSTSNSIADDDAHNMSPLMFAPTPGFETHRDEHAHGQLVIKRALEHEALMSDIRSFQALGICFDLSDFDAIDPEHGKVGHDIDSTRTETIWHTNAATTASRSDCDEETRASEVLRPAVTLNDAGGQLALNSDQDQCAPRSDQSLGTSRSVEPSLIPQHESSVQPQDSTVILSTASLCSHGMHPDEASTLVRRTQLWLGLLPFSYDPNHGVTPAHTQCRPDTRIASRLELLAWIAAERRPLRNAEVVM